MQELQLLCDGWGKGSPTKGFVHVWMASYGASGLGLDSGKASLGCQPGECLGYFCT